MSSERVNEGRGTAKPGAAKRSGKAADRGSTGGEVRAAGKAAPAGVVDRGANPERGARNAAVGKRLARIEGQVRGIARMVEEGRYCVDVLIQIAAVNQALRQVAQQLLTRHMEHCVRDAFESGDEEERRKVSAEIAELMFKYSR